MAERKSYIYQLDKRRAEVLAGFIPAIAVCAALSWSPSTFNRRMDKDPSIGKRDGRRRFVSVDWLRANVTPDQRSILDKLIAELLDDAL